MEEGILSLKWNNHNSTFIHTLSTLHKMEMYSDVTLACEGKYFSVHKLVLSICSEYFEEILSRTKCQHPVVVLKDIKHNDLEALLNYMYAGEANVAQSELANLIKAAKCLRIKGLAVSNEMSPVQERRVHLESSKSPQYCKERSEEAIDCTMQTVKEYDSSGNRLLDFSKSIWKRDPAQIFGNEKQNSEIIQDRDSNKWIPEIVLKGEPVEVKQKVAEPKIEDQEDAHQNLDNSNLQLDYNMNLGGDESNESGRHGQDSQPSRIIQGLMAHSLPGPSGVQGIGKTETMNAFVTRSADRSMSFSCDSAASSSSFRSSTLILSESSHRDSRMPFFVPETLIKEDEETGESNDQILEGNEIAVKELKSCLETLERFYVFDKFVRTDEKIDGRSLRKIHNGLAKCQHPGCNKVFTYSTHTRSHLKQHYKNMHKDQLPLLSAAIDGINKRGRSQSSERQAHKKRQMCLEENFKNLK